MDSFLFDSQVDFPSFMQPETITAMSDFDSPSESLFEIHDSSSVNMSDAPESPSAPSVALAEFETPAHSVAPSPAPSSPAPAYNAMPLLVGSLAEDTLANARAQVRAVQEQIASAPTAIPAAPMAYRPYAPSSAAPTDSATSGTKRRRGYDVDDDDNKRQSKKAKEKARRDRMNERFSDLIGLLGLPDETKADRVTILGDTIGLLRKLRAEVSDLRAQQASSKAVNTKLMSCLQVVMPTLNADTLEEDMAARVRAVGQTCVNPAQIVKAEALSPATHDSPVVA